MFIGGWHNLSLDTDVDGDDDLWTSGYSSTTMSHIGVLTITDSEDVIRDSVSPSFLHIPVFRMDMELKWDKHDVAFKQLKRDANHRCTSHTTSSFR